VVIIHIVYGGCGVPRVYEKSWLRFSWLNEEVENGLFGDEIQKVDLGLKVCVWVIERWYRQECPEWEVLLREECVSWSSQGICYKRNTLDVVKPVEICDDDGRRQEKRAVQLEVTGEEHLPINRIQGLTLVPERNQAQDIDYE
jgi:hypothetical protein